MYARSLSSSGGSTVEAQSTIGDEVSAKIKGKGHDNTPNVQGLLQLPEVHYACWIVIL